MRFGITSDLVRLRTMQKGEATVVARSVAQRVRGADERRLVELLERFSEGQILAFDSNGTLCGWSLHLRVSPMAVESLRRKGSPLLGLHKAEGTMLMTFDTEAPAGEAGLELREAFEAARQTLMGGLGLKRSLVWFAARSTQAA
jgi:hypothetical protein